MMETVHCYEGTVNQVMGDGHHGPLQRAETLTLAEFAALAARLS